MVTESDWLHRGFENNLVYNKEANQYFTVVRGEITVFEKRHITFETNFSRQLLFNRFFSAKFVAISEFCLSCRLAHHSVPLAAMINQNKFHLS